MDEFTRVRIGLFALMEAVPEARWDIAFFASGTQMRIEIPLDVETADLFVQARQMFAPKD